MNNKNHSPVYKYIGIYYHLHCKVCLKLILSWVMEGSSIPSSGTICKIFKSALREREMVFILSKTSAICPTAFPPRWCVAVLFQIHLLGHWGGSAGKRESCHPGRPEFYAIGSYGWSRELNP